MISGKSIQYSEQTITNDGFWPDVVCGDFERRRALPADMDADAISAALLAAVSEINLQLAKHQVSLLANGYTRAQEVPGPRLQGGNNALTETYLAAVFARAKAMLLPEFATVTERDARKDLAERAPDLREQLLSESQQLVRSIKGKHRVGVSMI
ncbi:head completion/stabilization protein [Aeromonas rivuli]|jgi:hypothetical protein|uniref:head completion/stabilization protein n=1 Tax=Aeromonas rivuli TaxID=648794 RepID=UPI0005A68A6A|nr:head completion/stabilization protein [Aeromonas rivuli]